MAVTPSNQLLLWFLGNTRLQQISSSGDLTDSVYDVSPLLPNAIHVISDNKLIVGAYNGKLKRSAVIIMNKKGDKETWIGFQMIGGKVVILGQEGHIINQYTGHPTINKSEPFKPIDIVTTPSDNVVVTGSGYYKSYTSSMTMSFDFIFQYK
ncbi:Hypothetical predicted protein [Mytilus galloprovincialis]|uniref:Uncharacterized protein n=1 Tax=Mytilus galloprovincialis TaxID=29158 RepID=A0A8B6HLW4_MYTGA|nr:Hypothetical predicted protein [Mytilus galloprovincialis]